MEVIFDGTKLDHPWQNRYQSLYSCTISQSHLLIKLKELLEQEGEGNKDNGEKTYLKLIWVL